MRDFDVEAWSVTWQSTAVTSFGPDLPSGYDGAFLAFWQRQARGPLDHLVDLACGNGALAWLFDDLLNRDVPRTRITGVDGARIAPFEALGRAPQDHRAIQFFGNTPLERLPFGDGTFDLAVSQYGVEYSDLGASIPEIARILKPSGRVAFIMHDRDGWLVRSATAPVHDYQMILDHVDAPEIILELARLCRAAGARPDEPATAGEYRRLMGRLDVTTQAFTSLYQRNPDIKPVLVYKSKLNQAFQEATKPEVERKLDLRAFLADARTALRHNIARIEDLARIALDEEGRQRLCALLRKEGFSVNEMGPLRYTNDEVWGTSLTAQRP